MLEPMLCQTGKIEDLEREGWTAEQKYDGTRGLLIKTSTTFNIVNRHGVNYTQRIPEITEDAKNFKETFIIDGEICYFAQGRTILDGKKTSRKSRKSESK